MSHVSGSPEGICFDDGDVVGGKVQDRDGVGHDVHQGLATEYGEKTHGLSR